VDATEPALDPAGVRTLGDLAGVLRALRRRQARRRGAAELSYREIAARTGWSHGIVGEYLSGRVLPPTERFDALVRLLGAAPAEVGALATARDRVDEWRRSAGPAGIGVPRQLPARVGVPRQLPAPVYAFTGRPGPLAELDGLLADGWSATPARQGPSWPGPGRPVVISAVAGTAGVGKTALAVQWAHRVADRFPDGQLYVDLRGYDPAEPLSPGAALGGFLRALGLPGADLPLDVGERAACYRTLLADRRVLVLLDNAHAADQVRPLLPGSPSCVVLVTSRDDLTGLVARDGAHRIHLDALTGAESTALLRALIGARVDAEPDAAVLLGHRCARLPLALRVAAELAAARPTVALADLVADLADERRRLDRFDASGDPRTAVRAVFSWSYRHLGPAAARAFDLLGVHPGRDIDGYAVAALTGTGSGAAAATLAELAAAHLVGPVRAGPAPRGRYRMHDLLRAYAVERAAELPGEVRRAALTRLFDHNLRAAAAAMDTLFPHERASRPAVPAAMPAAGPVADVPAAGPGVDVPGLAEPGAALDWLESERANLVAAARHAARDGWPGHCVDLSRVLWRYFEVRGHYQDALDVHTSAVACAAQGEPAAAHVLANLGSIHWWLGHHRDAERCFADALAGHRAHGDTDGEARALARLGLVHERLGRYAAALDALDAALASYRRAGDRYGAGAQLVNLGTLHRRQGRYAAAAECQEEAAAIFAALGEQRLEGYALGNLGALYRVLGRGAEALAHLERAMVRCVAAGDRGGEGSALGTLGAVYLQLARHAEAIDHLDRALSIGREVGDRSLETETLNTLGEALRAMGRPGQALDRHRAALALSHRAGDRYEQARALDGIAAALRDTGRPAPAHRAGRRALAIYAALGVPEAERLRVELSGSQSVAPTASSS
jgi:tetratricopeptide (TPR) repeat protein